MGTVYRVQHLISDRVEAMKVLPPDLGFLHGTGRPFYPRDPASGEPEPPQHRGSAHRLPREESTADDHGIFGKGSLNEILRTTQIRSRMLSILPCRFAKRWAMRISAASFTGT